MVFDYQKKKIPRWLYPDDDHEDDADDDDVDNVDISNDVTMTITIMALIMISTCALHIKSLTVGGYGQGDIDRSCMVPRLKFGILRMIFRRLAVCLAIGLAVSLTSVVVYALTTKRKTRREKVCFH